MLMKARLIVRTPNPRPAKRSQPERGVQRQIVMLLRHVGCQVWVLGTTRPSGDFMGTCQTPGTPDLICWLPRQLGVMFIEVKAPKGRLSPEQKRFRECAEAVQGQLGSGVHYVSGGVDAVTARLVALGLIRAEQVPHYYLAQQQMEERT